MIHVLDQLKKLTKSGKQLSGINGYEDLYEVVFSSTKALFNNECAAILLKNQKDGTLTIAASRGYNPEVVKNFKSGSPNKGITGTVFETGTPELVAETISDPRYVKGVENAVSEMAVPLRTPEGIVGVLDMESSVNRFTSADLALFATFGEQVATAIRNLNLQKGLEERAQKLVSISKAGQTITTITSVGEILGRIMDLTTEALELDTCSVQLFDDAGENLVVIAAKGYEDNTVGLKIPRGQGVTGRTAESRRPSLIPDVKKIDHYIPGLRDCRSEMAVPLIYKDDVIGVFNVEHKEPNRFNETDLLLTSIFADQAASAIGNAKRNSSLELKLAKLERRNRALELIVQASSRVNDVTDLDQLLDEILSLTTQALGVKRISVLLPDESGVSLRLRKSLGGDIAPNMELPIESSVTGEAYRVGTPILIPDVTKEPRYIAGLPGGRSEIVAPLKVGADVVGVIDAESVDKELTPDDLATLNKVAEQVAVAVRNVKQRAKMLERNRQLTLLHEATRSLNTLDNPEDMLSTILTLCRNALGMDRFTIWTPDEEEKHLEVRKALDPDEPKKMEIGKGFIGTMYVTGEAEIIGDIAEHDVPVQETPGTRCKMAVPLSIRGQTIAVLDAESDTPNAFTNSELDFLSYFGAHVIAALRAVWNNERLHKRGNRIAQLTTIREKIIGVSELVKKAGGEVGEKEQEMLDNVVAQTAMAIEDTRLVEDTQGVYYETLKSLAKALEARDNYTRGHSERVAELAKRIAEKMGVDAAEQTAIYNAALLHDIGKIGIRDEVLLSPKKLNHEEMEVIRRHPTYGNKILSPLKFLGEIRDFVMHHHERWDGAGYPEGRSEDSIPLASRIISVADTFDAMTSNRPYRHELSKEVATREIEAAAGSQFDPAVVEAFLEVISE